MIQIKFYPQTVPGEYGEQIRFSVIAARCRGKWVFVKHRKRSTYEMPGGKRERGEAADEAARRELTEETGATDFSISPVCLYSVTGPTAASPDGVETFGMLYLAEIHALGEIHSEIERIDLFDGLPEHMTYPAIQPALIRRVLPLVADSENQ